MNRYCKLILTLSILFTTSILWGQIQVVEKTWKNGNIAMKGLMKDGLEHGK